MLPDPVDDALWKRDIDMLREAIRDLPADIRDGEGLTPLMKAASSLFPEAVELLLANGADVTLRDNLGRSPHDHLHRALADLEFYEYPLSTREKDGEDRYRRIRAMLAG